MCKPVNRRFLAKYAFLGHVGDFGNAFWAKIETLLTASKTIFGKQ
jgi:hypothetical protein